MIKDSIYNENEYRYNSLDYTIGDEFIVLTNIDGQDCYTIGTVDLITITREEVVYCIEGSSKNIRKNEIMPNNRTSREFLQNNNYIYIEPYQL